MEGIASGFYQIRQGLACLSYPLRFLRVRFFYHPFLLLWLPLVVSGSAALMVVAWPEIPLRGGNSLIELMNALLGVLAGFYIAALTAVATFGSPAIDKQFIGEQPILPASLASYGEDFPLTRRQYLSLLFGFLSFMSISIYLAGVVVQLIPGALLAGFDSLPFWASSAARGLFALIYVYCLAAIVSATMLGLYFLSYAIHKPVLELSGNSPQPAGSDRPTDTGEVPRAG